MSKDAREHRTDMAHRGGVQCSAECQRLEEVASVVRLVIDHATPTEVRLDVRVIQLLVPRVGTRALLRLRPFKESLRDVTEKSVRGARCVGLVDRLDRATTCGEATVAEIEEFNILGATKLAMRRALEGIYPPSAFAQRTEPDLFASEAEVRAFQPQVACRILIDGLALRRFVYPHTGVVRGDARSLCIAMASIVAKVTRDRLMEGLEAKHPGYGFAQHKGYGTDEHRDALLRLGRCPAHRGAFLRKLMRGRVDPAQLSLFETG